MGAGQTTPRLRLSAGLRKFREQGKGAYGWSEAHRARVAAQVEYIRHWRVIEGGYVDAPDVEATWFVDPPYQGASGRHYRHGSRDIDYAHLAAWSRARRGQVVVCEALGADWLPFVKHSAPQRSAMNRRPSLIEAVWTNDTATDARAA